MWDDYTVHKTAACKEAMAKSNTTLFLLPGGLTPKVQPCDGLVNKLFKSSMTALHDQHMASPAIKRDDRGYPEPPSRGLLAQWVKKAWDKIDGKVVCSSWEKAGLLLPLDGSGDEAWARKELNSDAQGKPLDADAGEEGGGPEEDLLEVFDISDDDDTGAIGAGDDDDDEEDVGRGVGPEAGDGSNEVAGGGPGVPAAVDLTC